MRISNLPIPGISLMLLGVFSMLAGFGFLATTTQPLQLDLNFEVVDTPATRQIGLSNRDSLGNDQAMLFVFDEDDKHGIWMKDMRFSLDIVWLDSDREIVTIRENVSPSTFPEAFRPDKDSRYVIELNAGDAQKHDLEVGDQLTLPVL